MLTFMHNNKSTVAFGVGDIYFGSVVGDVIDNGVKLYVCLSACLPVCLPACLSVYITFRQDSWSVGH